jgi:hypothetical protein
LGRRVNRSALLGLMPNKSIVLGVSANPDPQEVVAVVDRQSSMVKAHADRPKLTDLLEV